MNSFIDEYGRRIDPPVVLKPRRRVGRSGLSVIPTVGEMIGLRRVERVETVEGKLRVTLRCPCGRVDTIGEGGARAATQKKGGAVHCVTCARRQSWAKRRAAP